MKLFTIGFTQKTAEEFFSRLKKAGVRKVVDVRLNNVSQLAGFAKKDDLRFFLREICGIDYEVMPQLAPAQDILDDFKKKKGSWESYKLGFLALMASRCVETINKEALDGSCLLCSEDKPDHCHRRLVAEYLRDKWGDIEIMHL